jgi:hypothetical protein
LKKNWNGLIYKKGTKPKFQWYYEIDMDNASEKELNNWKKHLMTKTYIIENPYILKDIEKYYKAYLKGKEIIKDNKIELLGKVIPIAIDSLAKAIFVSKSLKKEKITKEQSLRLAGKTVRSII